MKLLPLLLIGLLALPCFGDDLSETAVGNMFPRETPLSIGGTLTTTVYRAGATILGVEWGMSSGFAMSVAVTIKCSNDRGGPFTTWTSLAGTSFTDSFTLSTGSGGSDLRLPPSRYIQVTVQNQGAAMVNLHKFLIFRGGY